MTTTTTTIEPGIHDLTREQYDALPYVNQSLLNAANRSMARAKAYIDGSRKDSDTLAFGKDYHTFLLEPAKFATDYVVVEKRRRQGKAWEAVLEEVTEQGKTIVWTEDVETFTGMRAALVEKKNAAGEDSLRSIVTTAPGQYEVSIVWDDPRSGLRCKARVDKLMPAMTSALDLKKTRDARAFKFAASAATYGYDIQASHTIDGLHVLTGKWYDFLFLCQEDERPYDSVMRMVTPNTETFKSGIVKRNNLMALITQCQKTGNWPGYSDDVEELVMPKYAIVEGIDE